MREQLCRVVNHSFLISNRYIDLDYTPGCIQPFRCFGQQYMQIFLSGSMLHTQITQIQFWGYEGASDPVGKRLELMK